MGTIEGQEVQALADCVFESFHPDNEPLGDDERDLLRIKLMKRLDDDTNGRLDFEEFAEWFTRTCEGISQFRQNKARTERAGAATKLQGKARQRKAKQKVEGVKQDNAATKMQAKQRQRKAKQKVEGVKQDNAATKMQAKQRQRQAKKQVEELKSQQ